MLKKTFLFQLIKETLTHKYPKKRSKKKTGSFKKKGRFNKLEKKDFDDLGYVKVLPTKVLPTTKPQEEQNKLKEIHEKTLTKLEKLHQAAMKSLNDTESFINQHLSILCQEDSKILSKNEKDEISQAFQEMKITYQKMSQKFKELKEQYDKTKNLDLQIIQEIQNLYLGEYTNNIQKIRTINKNLEVVEKTIYKAEEVDEKTKTTIYKETKITKKKLINDEIKKQKDGLAPFEKEFEKPLKTPVEFKKLITEINKNFKEKTDFIEKTNKEKKLQNAKENEDLSKKLLDITKLERNYQKTPFLLEELKNSEIAFYQDIQLFREKYLSICCKPEFESLSDNEKEIIDKVYREMENISAKMTEKYKELEEHYAKTKNLDPKIISEIQKIYSGDYINTIQRAILILKDLELLNDEAKTPCEELKKSFINKKGKKHAKKYFKKTLRKEIISDEIKLSQKKEEGKGVIPFTNFIIKPLQRTAKLLEFTNLFHKNFAERNKLLKNLNLEKDPQQETKNEELSVAFSNTVKEANNKVNNENIKYFSFLLKFANLVELYKKMNTDSTFVSGLKTLYSIFVKNNPFLSFFRSKEDISKKDSRKNKKISYINKLEKTIQEHKKEIKQSMDPEKQIKLNYQALIGEISKITNEIKKEYPSKENKMNKLASKLKEHLPKIKRPSLKKEAPQKSKLPKI